MRHSAARRRLPAWAAAVGIGLAVAAVGEGVFLVVVSRDGFRAWLKTELDQGGGSFSFGAVGGWPLGVTLADAAFVARGPSHLRSVRAPVARASFQWRPLLLERRLVLEDVVLSRAAVELRLDGGHPERIALPLLARRISLEDSAVRIDNLSGWTATLRGVDAELGQTGSGAATVVAGSLSGSRAAVGALGVESLRADFRLAERRLSLISAAGTLYGGALEARGALRLDAPQTLEDIHITASRAEILPLFKALGYSNRFGGRARFEADCAGRFSPGAHGLQGRGRVSVESMSAQADLPRVNFFNIAPALKELRRVDGLAGGFGVRLDGERFLLDDLVLENKDVRITGSGSVTVIGGLAFDVSSRLGPRLAQGVPGFVASSLRRGDNGGLDVPFRLENTLAEPRANMDGVMKGALLRPLKKVFD